jgi:hypothetical protein
VKVDIITKTGKKRYREGVKAVMVAYGGQKIVMLLPSGERVEEVLPAEIHVFVDDPSAEKPLDVIVAPDEQKGGAG